MSSISTQAPKTVTLVTGNQGKLKEFVTIFSSQTNFNFQIKSIDLPEYQGDIDDICIRKGEDAFKLLNSPVLVEDTSLCFKALGGLPGPYVKWFLQKLGPEGLYKILADFPDKTATAVCTLAYVESGNVKLFRGETEGTCVPPRGSNGFGWDKCFQPSGYQQTYAEMSPEIKNQISHRYKAIHKLKTYFETATDQR